MDWKTQTVKVYNEAAKELAEYFKGIGARIDDIELGLKLAHVDKNNARVVEIGCGDGRDAEEIVKRVEWYEGYDPSIELLKIAREKVPAASFVEADALTYKYPENLDVVFAFASLLHVDRTDMKVAFEKIASSLREGGIAYISLKERPEYVEEIKKDEYGKRMFYYYTPPIIKEIAGKSFSPVHENHLTIGHTDWFTLALKKN